MNVFIFLRFSLFLVDVGFQSWNILLFINLINSGLTYSFLTLIFLNVFSYLIVFLLLLVTLLIFDISKIKTLNELKLSSNLYFYTFSIMISILSMAGFPPLFGFISKSILFMGLLYASNFFFLTLLTFVNFFIIYFYIHNLRFLASQKSYNYFYVRKHYVFITFNLVFYTVILLFTNGFGIFFFNEFVIYFNSIIVNLVIA